MDRIHTKTIGDAREHLAQAEAMLRYATLADTGEQGRAAVVALAELKAASALLRPVAKDAGPEPAPRRHRVVAQR